MNKIVSLAITSAITLIFSVSCAFGAELVLTNKLPSPKEGRQIVLEGASSSESVPFARCL